MRAADVFVRDTVAGTTTLVSVDSTGTQGNGLSGDPAISADGHYVAFQSGASNLVTGDTNEFADVFVRDTVAGTTIRVNVDSDGTQADLAGLDPAISADGHYVAFASLATNMVAGDADPWIDVFVRNIVAGTTSRLSVDSAGRAG